MERITLNEADAGCYLDSHRGHYAIPAMIELAVGYGYIIDPFAEYVLSRYDADNENEDYPHECLIELANEACEWLNCGDNDWDDPSRIKGQNQPPVIPDGYSWQWNDGDFGLYADDEDSL